MVSATAYASEPQPGLDHQGRGHPHDAILLLAPSCIGVYMATERSGKKSWVYWRLQCPKFLRQTFVEWTAESTRHSFWAQVYYQQQRDKGKAHQAAVAHHSFATWRIEPEKD